MSGRRLPSPRGPSITVIPGYQGMTQKQRLELLDIVESGELRRTVYARQLASGAWRVTDHEHTFVIYLDGTSNLVANRPGGGV